MASRPDAGDGVCPMDAEGKTSEYTRCQDCGVALAATQPLQLPCLHRICDACPARCMQCAVMPPGVMNNIVCSYVLPIDGIDDAVLTAQAYFGTPEKFCFTCCSIVSDAEWHEGHDVVRCDAEDVREQLTLLADIVKEETNPKNHEVANDSEIEECETIIEAHVKAGHPSKDKIDQWRANIASAITVTNKAMWSFDMLHRAASFVSEWASKIAPPTPLFAYYYVGLRRARDFVLFLPRFKIVDLVAQIRHGNIAQDTVDRSWKVLVGPDRTHDTIHCHDVHAPVDTPMIMGVPSTHSYGEVCAYYCRDPSLPLRLERCYLAPGTLSRRPTMVPSTSHLKVTGPCWARFRHTGRYIVLARKERAVCITPTEIRELPPCAMYNVCVGANKVAVTKTREWTCASTVKPHSFISRVGDEDGGAETRIYGSNTSSKTPVPAILFLNRRYDGSHVASVTNAADAERPTDVWRAICHAASNRYVWVGVNALGVANVSYVNRDDVNEQTCYTVELNSASRFQIALADSDDASHPTVVILTHPCTLWLCTVGKPSRVLYVERTERMYSPNLVLVSGEKNFYVLKVEAYGETGAQLLIFRNGNDLLRNMPDISAVCGDAVHFSACKHPHKTLFYLAFWKDGILSVLMYDYMCDIHPSLLYQGTHGYPVVGCITYGDGALYVTVDNRHAQDRYLTIELELTGPARAA